jgi:hypothetical protein
MRELRLDPPQLHIAHLLHPCRHVPFLTRRPAHHQLHSSKRPLSTRPPNSRPNNPKGVTTHLARESAEGHQVATAVTHTLYCPQNLLTIQLVLVRTDFP